jgi:hypothetical protein
MFGRQRERDALHEPCNVWIQRISPLNYGLGY